MKLLLQKRTLTFPDLESSSYTLKVFDVNGCTFESIVFVDQPNEFDVSLASSDISCLV